MQRSVVAWGILLAVTACAGERSNATRVLETAQRDAASESDLGTDMEPSASGDDAMADAGEEAPPKGDEKPGADMAPDAGLARDAAPDGNADATPIDGVGPDGPLRDAGMSDAASRDAAAKPVEAYAFAPALTFGVLPEAVAAAAVVPTGAGELAQQGAQPYETVSGLINLGSALPADEGLPGLTAVVLIRWGFLTNVTAPANPGEWHDLSGYLALGEGNIELVRAVRWNGATEPSAPRPPNGVAPQTDPRVVRFASFIGAGSEGIVVRLRRPSFQPVVVKLSIAGAVRDYPFEFFLATRGSSGGWQIPYGQASTETVVVPSSRCYVRTGELLGTLKYRATPNTALASFTGNVRRLDGSLTPLTLTSEGALQGPYGAVSVSFGAEAAVTQGYFGRYWQFGGYDNSGMIIGQLGPGVDAATQEVFVANFNGSVISSSVVKPAACDAPNAVMRSPFVF